MQIRDPLDHLRVMVDDGNYLGYRLVRKKSMSTLLKADRPTPPNAVSDHLVEGTYPGQLPQTAENAMRANTARIV